MARKRTTKKRARTMSRTELEKWADQQLKTSSFRRMARYGISERAPRRSFN